jgi:hypothetical protein
MVSKKKYIYTIDDDCFVAKKPTGEDINALEQHIRYAGKACYLHSAQSNLL